MNRKFFLIAVIVMLTGLSAHSQNLKADYTKKIVGTWKVDSLEIGNFNLSPEYEAIIKQKMPEIIAMTEVRFNSNKKYYKQGMEGTTEGTWEISKDGVYVLVKLNGESTISRTKIITLTDSKLIMSPDDENATNSKAYLYKVK